MGIRVGSLCLVALLCGALRALSVPAAAWFPLIILLPG